METVYLETTIVSYLVARPSRDLIVAGHQQLTREWWDHRRSNFDSFISQLVLDEAAAGEGEQAALRLRALHGLPLLTISPEVERLAGEFVQRVLPPSAARDAVHLAAAVANKLDYLLTWNCAHLANAQILKRLDPVAEAAGFKLPRVCTPEELMGMSGYE